MKTRADIVWMNVLMGFCLLALFGGYAIWLPELFPTRLRATGTSFCYNVGRFIAASGPLVLGYLTTDVFAYAKTPETPDLPFRYAGLAMCSIFAARAGGAAVPAGDLGSRCRSRWYLVGCVEEALRRNAPALQAVPPGSMPLRCVSQSLNAPYVEAL
ncbi:MAG: hypothetical protein U0871_21220 [Gemmataceae bacterium]